MATDQRVIIVYSMIVCLKFTMHIINILFINHQIENYNFYLFDVIKTALILGKNRSIFKSNFISNYFSTCYTSKIFVLYKEDISTIHARY